MLPKIILSKLVSSEPYARKVLPHLKEEYFREKSEQVVYGLIHEFYEVYNRAPTYTALETDIGDIATLQDFQTEAASTLLGDLQVVEDVADEWLLDRTEAFCRDAAIYNAIYRALNIVDGKDKQLTEAAIPEILTEALAVSFDTNIGHDYAEDAEARYQYYHAPQVKVPFDIDVLNYITKGGFAKKTCNIWMAGTNVGKTFAMCHCAAYDFMAGKNVLYITMEMSEEEIGKRIDANLLGISIDEVEALDHVAYMIRTKRVKERAGGKLIIKQYPTSAAGVGEFRVLLQELRLKKGFVPDCVYVDYIGICKSSRVKDPSNMYAYGKAVAEELRALAVEFNFAMITAIQTNREGFADGDVELKSAAESFGVPMTADFLCAIMTSEELEARGQFAFKQLKNRYRNKTKLLRFVVGVDRETMRLYNLDRTDAPPPDKKKKGIKGSEEVKEVEEKPMSRLDKERELLYDSIDFAAIDAK